MMWIDLHCAKCATTVASTSSSGSSVSNAFATSRQWLLSKPVSICLFVRWQLRVSPAAATALLLLWMALLLMLCELSGRSTATAAAEGRQLSHL
jgi:hypothetical protein